MEGFGKILNKFHKDFYFEIKDKDLLRKREHEFVKILTISEVVGVECEISRQIKILSVKLLKEIEKDQDFIIAVYLDSYNNYDIIVKIYYGKTVEDCKTEKVLIKRN